MRAHLSYRSRLVASAALLAAALVSGRAMAQEPPKPAPASAAEADATFRRGLERYDAKDYVGAIAIWEALVETLGVEKAWKALYNLGLAYQGSGDATLAVQRFEQFLGRIAEVTGALPAELEERRQDAAERLRSIKASHGAIRVRPPASGEIVPVRVGARPARPAGFTAYVTPGEIEIAIGDPGPRARTIKVTAVAGTSVEVDATLAAIAPPRIEPPPIKGTPAVAFPTAWVATGAGLTAASFALPIALAVRASGLRSDAEALGAGSTRYSAGVTVYESARSTYYVSYALPAALGAATAAIAIVGLARRRPASVRAGAAMGPGGGALWLSGSF